MLKKFFPAFIFAILLCGALPAQKSYWIFFTDKHGTSFDPYSYFAPEAIERRNRLGISLYDSTDFPVSEKYIAEVSAHVAAVGHSSRWLNGVGVDATDAQIAEVKTFPFVREVVEQPEVMWTPACFSSVPDTAAAVEEAQVLDQVKALGGNLFAEHGLTGKGIIIAVIDVGFAGVDKAPAFASIRFNNRIRATYDFAKDRADVYAQKNANHGTMVLSCIAGTNNGTQLGLAPDAFFLLAKVATPWTNQKHGEENFIAALEWADKQGAMLVNCSDGPDYESYFPEQMNGKVSLMSRASNMAASKGMLVIAAAGNEGESSSPVLLPPAEADSVLSVTALGDNGVIASYSSVGPTPDFKHKPDVCAPGNALVANGDGGKTEYSEGTSFSAPLIVGFAACLIQKFPDLSPMQLMDTLHKFSSLYPYYDYAHGYGTPQASYFFDTTAVHLPSFTFKRNADSVTVIIDEKFKPDCGSRPFPKFYYNLEDEQGRIYEYNVFELLNGNPVIISGNLRAGIKINVFYRGYYASLQL